MGCGASKEEPAENKAKSRQQRHDEQESNNSNRRASTPKPTSPDSPKKNPSPRGSRANSDVLVAPAIVADGTLTWDDMPNIGGALEHFTGDHSSLSRRLAAIIGSFNVERSGSNGESGDSDSDDGDGNGKGKGSDSLATTLIDGALFAEVTTLFAISHNSFAMVRNANVNIWESCIGVWDTPVTKRGAMAPSGPFLTIEEHAASLKHDAINAVSYQESLRLVSMCVSALLGDTAAAVAARVINRNEPLDKALNKVAGILNSSGGQLDVLAKQASNAVFGDEGTKVVQGCVRTGLKLLYTSGGGNHTIFADDTRPHQEADVALGKLLEVEGLNLIIALFKLGRYNPSEGMHNVSKVTDELNGMRDLLVALGVLDVKKANKADFLTWCAQLPLFALGDEAKSILSYLFAVIHGQQSRKLSPILRSAIMSSSIVALRKSTGVDSALGAVIGDGEVSHKMFPIFAKEGVGLESGEGHGPRKEFFDSVGIALTSKGLPEVDLSSAARLHLINAEDARALGLQAQGGSVVVLNWIRVKLINQFAAGDTIALSFKLANDDEVGDGGDEEVDANVTEMKMSILAVLSTTLKRRRTAAQIAAAATVSDDEEENDSANGGAISDDLAARGVTQHSVLLAVNTGIPHDASTISKVTVIQAAQPLFLHEAGKRYAWLNMSIPTTGAQWHAQFAFAGWCLANSVANGVVVPVALPPYFFSVLRRWLAAGTDHSAKITQWDTSLAASDRDLPLIDPSLVELVDQARSMNANTFQEMLMAEGLGEEDGYTGSHEAQLQKYVKDIVIGESVMPAERHQHVQHMCEGFASCGIHQCPVFSASTSRQLQRMFCGATDDGKSDFSFDDQFRFLWDNLECAPTAKYDHSREFCRVVLEVIEGYEPSMKRQLLKFVTGRTLLPARPKAEHIKLEFPLAPMKANDFDKALMRLPSSHSCDNVFELPNFMEGVLFGNEGIWYAVADKEPGCMILDHHREQCWKDLDERQQRMVRKEVSRVFKRKLTKAVQQTDTYELDDNVIDDKQRKLFDSCFSSVDGSPTKRAGGTSSLGHVSTSQSFQAEHTTSFSDVSPGGSARTPQRHGGRSSRLETLHTVEDADTVMSNEQSGDHNTTSIPELSTSYDASLIRGHKSHVVPPRQSPRAASAAQETDADNVQPERAQSRTEDLDNLMAELYPGGKP